MRQSENEPVAALLAELRRCAQAAGNGPVTIDAGHAQLLADELSRLLQSAHRLRQQNTKLRKRIARLRGGYVSDVEFGLPSAE
jgi:hypothetical protein